MTGIRQTLLETPADRVSAELTKTVADFCGPLDVIKTAWVGLIEIARDFHAPEQHLGRGVRAVRAGRRRPRRATASCASSPTGSTTRCREEILEGGCNFLEPGGIDAWAAKAQKVFSR